MDTPVSFRYFKKGRLMTADADRLVRLVHVPEKVSPSGVEQFKVTYTKSGSALHYTVLVNDLTFAALEQIQHEARAEHEARVGPP